MTITNVLAQFSFVFASEATKNDVTTAIVNMYSSPTGKQILDSFSQQGRVIQVADGTINFGDFSNSE